ncbi:hypothetical protein DAETH_25660 [Deinococcus aetherius]|uniref:Uncharacterized protein n=1 Tax=Deinococcus aetherius TaxID=200252 RepID=A0ABM8AFK9_9DEIO|nr:hypothetical protein [Deinococcus aetherius]BDP42597.1 hypothetical protein DAETH_25660 [Deinococcus aetherius]
MRARPNTDVSRRAPSRQDPLVALHVINGHAKRLSRELEAATRAGQTRRAGMLRQERAYLYTLKDKGARVLLEEGRLRPVRVEGDWLLLEGDSPLGPLGFHVPREAFGEAAQGVPHGKGRVPGALRRARRVTANSALPDAIAVVTRLIARARVRKRSWRPEATQGSE